MGHCPAQHTAIRWLRRHVEEKRRAGERRLASAVVLARRADVSHVTMLSALRRLHAEGAIEVHRGRATRIRGTGKQLRLGTEEEKQHERVAAAERIARRIQADILQKNPSVGNVLSSHKSLQAHYGSCYRTVKRALRLLEARELIERDGRGYRVSPIVSERGDTIVFITRGDDPNHVTLVPPRGHAYLHALDREASRAGVRVDVAPYWFVGPGRMAGTVDWRDRSNAFVRERRILGFVVWPTALALDPGSLIRELAPYGVPIAVIDESCAPRPPPVPGRADVLWIEAVNSRRAGERMGRHLLAAGHRRVAYICAHAAHDWSTPRLEGLSCVYAQADLPGAVTACRQVSPSLPQASRAALDAAVRGHLGDTLLRSSEKPPNPMPSRAVVERFWGRMLSPVQGSLGWAAVESLPVARSVLSLAHQALQRRDITAWVGSNALTATILLELLAVNGLAVPDDLSVAGFDDTVQASAHRLTTYSFNPEATIGYAVRHVLGAGRRGRARSGLERVVVDGFVNVRATVGTPAAHSS